MKKLLLVPRLMKADSREKQEQQRPFSQQEQEQ